MAETDDSRSWIAARNAREMVAGRLGKNPHYAAQTIVQWARGHMLPSRCTNLLADREPKGKRTIGPEFWRRILDNQGEADWQAGIFSVSEYSGERGGNIKTTAYAVEFDLDELERQLGDAGAPKVSVAPPPLTPQTNRGRPRKAIWDALWAEIAAQMIHGEFLAYRQADIENAMANWLAEQNEYPGESTIREPAAALWKALNAKARKYPK